MDMCRWALGEDLPPRRVISIGGRVGYDDDGETANTQIAFFDYEKAPLIFEVRGLPMKSDMNAHIPVGHISASLSHMANISHRLGQEASTDKIRESITAMKFVPDRLEQLYKHLDANHVDSDKTRMTLGAWLEFDPQTERFTGTLADEANKLATRNYREPFVVPENV